MATNLDLDDKLIDAARRLGGHKTKRDAVTRRIAILRRMSAFCGQNDIRLVTELK